MEKMQVATVTKEELSLVDNILLNTKQLNLLTAKTPKKFLMTRPAKGGGTWTYVTGSYMKKVLNLMFGFNWDFEIIEYKFDLDIKQVFVLGKLKCRTGKTEIVKMQFGRADIKFKTEWIDGKKTVTNEPLDIGNDLKSASTDALKKCASEIGIASDIYGKNEFKELLVVEKKTDEEKKEQLTKLLNEAEDISETNRLNIERMLDLDEVQSYDNAIEYLLTLKKPTK